MASGFDYPSYRTQPACFLPKCLSSRKTDRYPSAKQPLLRHLTGCGILFRVSLFTPSMHSINQLELVCQEIVSVQRCSLHTHQKSGCGKDPCISVRILDQSEKESGRRCLMRTDGSMTELLFNIH